MVKQKHKQNNKQRNLKAKQKQIIDFIKNLKKQYKKTDKNIQLSTEQRLPWKVLIATILSARTRDETTAKISKKLFKKYPSINKLAKANPKSIKAIIKPIGFYNTKAKNIIKTAKIITKKYKGKFPSDFAELVKLPGVGRKVANCVLLYGFKKEVIPVDTWVHKLSNKYSFVKTKTPEQTEKKLMQLVPKRYWKDINHYFILYGKDKWNEINSFRLLRKKSLIIF